MDRVVTEGKVFATKSALVATRDLFYMRTQIELSADDSLEQEESKGTIVKLQEYQRSVKNLLYDLTEPIVFSAKQLPGIMKFHHAQQSGQNGQSITQK